MDEFYDKEVTTARWRGNYWDYSDSLPLSLRTRVYSLDASAIIQPVRLEPAAELSPNGHNLAGVMDSLRDKEPERFEALNEEFGRWLPEFDRILFETPKTGHRAFYYEHEKAIMRCQLETCPKGRCWPWPFSPWRISLIHPH